MSAPVVTLRGQEFPESLQHGLAHVAGAGGRSAQVVVTRHSRGPRVCAGYRVEWTRQDAKFHSAGGSKRFATLDDAAAFAAVKWSAVLAWATEHSCYACDACAVGSRDRRPEGGQIERACARHAEPSTLSLAVAS